MPKIRSLPTSKSNMERSGHTKALGSGARRISPPGDGRRAGRVSRPCVVSFASTAAPARFSRLRGGVGAAGSAAGVVVGHALLEGFDALGDVAHDVGNLAFAAEQQQRHRSEQHPVPNAQTTHGHRPGQSPNAPASRRRAKILPANLSAPGGKNKRGAPCAARSRSPGAAERRRRGSRWVAFRQAISRRARRRKRNGGKGAAPSRAPSGRWRCPANARYCARSAAHRSNWRSTRRGWRPCLARSCGQTETFAAAADEASAQFADCLAARWPRSGGAATGIAFSSKLSFRLRLFAAIAPALSPARSARRRRRQAATRR